jgi:uncharacterized protein (TIGR02302 family)
LTSSSGSEAGPAQKLDALARRAAWALSWERVWPPLAWSGAVVAVFLAASWFGLWFAAPRLARVGGLALFALALLATLAPLVRLRRPSRLEALARLDGDAPDAHRPASAFDDRLANGMGDETTDALWALHRARVARRIDALSTAPPAPGMTKRDPRALRFAALLLALAAGWLAGPERYARVAAAFDWRGGIASAAPARVDAWIDPPPYTNKPPLLLKVAAQEKPESVVAPQNSVLIVRADPEQVETRIEGGLTPSTPEAPKPAPGAPSERRFVIHGDGKFTLLRGGSPLAAFLITATPAGAPAIALIDPPQSNVSGSLTLHYSIADAYGVAGAQAQFALPEAAGGAPTHSLVEAPKIGLPLPAGAGVGEARTTSDLSEHPWAGAKVVMTLQATDVAGATGESPPVTLTLPQRRFVNPLARALVEQRRGLILDPDHDRPRLAKALDALMIAPEAFDTTPGVYLGLRTAKTSLEGARSDKDLVAVADLLWAMALQIEDGDASRALRELRAAEQKLREALQRGASDDEIKALTKELREKAEEYMRELAQQNPNSDADEAPLDSQDLESMLDRMEDTARNGARDDAEAMLDQMQDMFENLKSGRSAQSSPAEREMRKQMSELDKLLRDQQALRDKTFRRQQRKRSQHPAPDGGAQPPQDSQDQDSESLDQEQGELRDRLAELQRRLKELGMQGEKGFDEAEGDMSEAQGDLKGEGQGQGSGENGAPAPDGKGGKGRGGGKGGDAVDAQGRALQALREGAQGLAKQMQGQGGSSGRALTMGRRGTRNQPGGDPLGRGPNGQRGVSEGQLNEGPVAAERARRVLQELRRRLADPNRPTDERDYLERLLRHD